MQDKGIYPGPGDEAFANVSFSDAEIAVIRLVCQGKTLNEIIKALSLSEGRIKEIISGILSKTGFDSITKFSIYAVANGYVVPEHSGRHPPSEHAAGAVRETETDGPEEFLPAGNMAHTDTAANMSAFYTFKRNVTRLSQAEEAVYTLYSEGYSAAQIAEKLFVSINTIKSHNKNIYKKLNVTSLKELMVYANMMKTTHVRLGEE
jgi:DNA-binding NarL/FixJ family response regulator